MTNNNSPNTNFPDGFRGFQCRAEALTDSLGGTEAARVIVEQAFHNCLRDLVGTRLYGKLWASGERFSTLWLAATDLDFQAAADAAERKFTKPTLDITESWDSQPLNGKIVLRTIRVYLERTDYAIMLAMAHADDSARVRIHPAQTTRLDPWRIFLTDEGETITKMLRTKPSNLSSNAQGLVGAEKTLRRFAALFV